LLVAAEEWTENFSRRRSCACVSTSFGDGGGLVQKSAS
jgi:hypothetical protein